MITKEQLISIFNPGESRVDDIFNSLIDTFTKYEIDTQLRECHFLAQILHESGCFRYTQEIWGPTEGQKGYEGRHDLGNNQSGDGKKYMGRGWIQVTGKANYLIVSQDLKHDFLNKPEDLAKYPWASISAGWFWNKHNLNIIADKDGITEITKIINGGLNGFDDRLSWLHKCKSVLMP